MTSIRHPGSPDLEDVNAAATQAILSVAPASRVLCLDARGCGVAAALVARGCSVQSVATEDSAALEPALAGAAPRDLDAVDLAAAGERPVDAVLLIDALGRARDPRRLLERSAAVLAPGGRVVAVIPSFVHGAVRLSLLRGVLEYSGGGLLDRRVLHRFDLREIERLFRDAGLEIRERLRTRRGLAETEIPVDLAALPPELVREVGSAPEATTYEYVIVAARASETGRADHGRSLAERLQDSLDAAERRIVELEAQSRAASEATQEAERLRQRTAELSSELARRVEEMQRDALERRHLYRDLATKETLLADVNAAYLKHEQLSARVEELEQQLAAAARHAEHQQADIDRLNAVVRSPIVRAVMAISGWVHRPRRPTTPR